jgi:hypothetical protein
LHHGRHAEDHEHDELYRLKDVVRGLHACIVSRIGLAHFT